MTCCEYEKETECASCRGRDGCAGRKITEEQTVFWETGHVALVSPHDSTEEHVMWDRGELHAMEGDEWMRLREREPRSDEDEDEEQEEEHQKARAIASPELPSRREVEDHNLTHVPFRSRCNHCMGGRGRRRASIEKGHDGSEGVDDRAVTTFSVDHGYLTEDGNAEERDAGEGTVRGSRTLVRPIIEKQTRKWQVQTYKGKWLPRDRVRRCQ